MRAKFSMTETLKMRMLAFDANGVQVEKPRNAMNVLIKAPNGWVFSGVHGSCYVPDPQGIWVAELQKEASLAGANNVS